MKRLMAFFIIVILLFGLASCSQIQAGTKGREQKESTIMSMESDTPETTGKNNRILVAYFSATGTTRPLAEYAADILSADLYEIVPEEPYTEADLAYYTNGRADREQDDPNARPAISGSVEGMADYDIVFIGYPIWHGQAPQIISTFLESYDFSGKTVVPFCTSHSSGIGSSDTNLHALAEGADWLAGSRFASGTSRSAIEEWIGGLDLPKIKESAETIRAFDFDTKTITLNSGYEMPINGLGTYSLHGEECIKAVKSAIEQGVRLIDTAHMYGIITEAVRRKPPVDMPCFPRFLHMLPENLCLRFYAFFQPVFQCRRCLYGERQL